MEDSVVAAVAPNYLRSGRRWAYGYQSWRLSSCLLGATVLLACAGAFAWCRPLGGRPAAPMLGAQPSILAASSDQLLRKAQGLCLELPGVELGAIHGKSLDKVSVATADDCVEHCRALVDCGQVVSDGQGSCYLWAATTSVVASLHDKYRSAYCGMLTDMRDMKAQQKKLLHDIKARKSQGVCVELHGLQLAAGEDELIVSSEGRGIGSASECFEECRKLPSCKQATFSESSSACSLSTHAAKRINEVGDDFTSAYCGVLEHHHRMKELREDVQNQLRMRRAQGICLDLESAGLADGRAVEGPKTAAACTESCRRAPNCAQASFSEGISTCFLSNHATKSVALIGDGYESSYCGPLDKTMDMKAMQRDVKEGIQKRKTQGICVEVEAIALGGDTLVELPDVSQNDCFERCRTVPGCGQAVFTQGGETCHLFKKAAAKVAHVGEAYTSTFCGTPEEVAHVKKLREEVQTAVQMRRAMGICEEMPGVQLADTAGGGRLAAFAPGVNASARGCVEKCRREPHCAQAIFSSGNSGCYLFKEAADVAVHANEIYHSAFCGEVKEAKRIQEGKDKVLQQVKMRRATGMCTDIVGVQIADGSGYHDAIFSNETGTPAKCTEYCRRQLGCEQAVFSRGNKGCYVFEKASNVKAMHEGGIFHSAYCGDLKQAKLVEARKKEIERQVRDRKSNGLCFEVPGIRASDGVGGAVATLTGNATQKKCVERCRTMLGCEQAIFSAKHSECRTFEKAVVDLFPGMVEPNTYHSAFCGVKDDWKIHKDQQVKVQKLAVARKKAGACMDLPGVSLVVPEGRNFYSWADNATQCTEHCRIQPYCGQALYTNKSCQLFQNSTVKFSALGKKYHSARCSDWKDFDRVRGMQNQTLALMKAPA